MVRLCREVTFTHPTKDCQEKTYRNVPPKWALFFIFKYVFLYISIGVFWRQSFALLLYMLSTIYVPPHSIKLMAILLPACPCLISRKTFNCHILHILGSGKTPLVSLSTIGSLLNGKLQIMMGRHNNTYKYLMENIVWYSGYSII